MKNGGLILWDASVMCNMSSWQIPDERRFGEPLQGPVIPFGVVVESHPISAKDQ